MSRLWKSEQPNPEQPSGDHASVVHHEHVTGCEQVRQVDDMPVRQRTGLPVEHKQARRVPRLARDLCDQFLRKIEIKLGNKHSRKTGTTSFSGDVPPVGMAIRSESVDQSFVVDGQPNTARRNSRGRIRNALVRPTE